MSTVPALLSSCIAPDSTGKNLYLIGTSAVGKVEAYFVDLSVTPPVAKSISSNTNSGWRAEPGTLGCNTFPTNTNNANNANSPINVIQFGRPSIQATFFPNGTWITPVSAPTTSAPTNITAPPPPPAPLPPIDYQSPQTFTLLAALNNTAWYLGKTLDKSWRSIRKGWTDEARQQESTLSTSDPLVIVGAVFQDATRALGHLYAFDQSGASGVRYAVSGSRNVTINAQNPLISLSQRSPIDMDGIQLTASALTAPSISSAFVVDKSANNTVDIFMLDGRAATARLTRLISNDKKAPEFLAYQSVTALNGRIAIYGGQAASGPSNAVHVFDILAGLWAGPSLIDLIPTVSDDQGSSGPSGALIGGIAAGAVVLLLFVIGYFVHLRRAKARRRHRLSEDESKQQMLKMLMLENKSTHHVNVDPPSKSEVPGSPQASATPSWSKSKRTTTISRATGNATPPSRPSVGSSPTTLKQSPDLSSYSPSVISLVPASPSIYGGELPSEPVPPIPTKHMTQDQYVELLSNLQRRNTNPMSPVVPDTYAQAGSESFTKVPKEKRPKRQSREQSQHYSGGSRSHGGHKSGGKGSSSSSGHRRDRQSPGKGGPESSATDAQQRRNSSDYKVEYVELSARSSPSSPASSAPNSPRSRPPRSGSSSTSSGRLMPPTTVSTAATSAMRSPSPSAFPLPPQAPINTRSNEGSNSPTVVTPLSSSTFPPPPPSATVRREKQSNAAASQNRTSDKQYSPSPVPPSPKSPHLESLPRPLARPAFNHSQIRQESAYYQQQQQQQQSSTVTTPRQSPKQDRPTHSKASSSSASSLSSTNMHPLPSSPPPPHLKTAPPTQQDIDAYQPPPSPVRSEADTTVIHTAARTRIQYDIQS
ncbi:hypothetical protein BGW41_003544 [Actinomortierella wolfii]|nr:hypothetical protein BGW41_003544 [Actinomortierella wolfii]